MPSSLDARHALLPMGRSVARVDLRHEPLPHAPSRPGRLEARRDGALLHVPADSSYMASTSGEPVLRDGRVAVEGRCLGPSGALGVVARMRSNGTARSGYSLLVQPGTRSFVLIDFLVDGRASSFRVLHGWQHSEVIRGFGDSNQVELRYVGHTLQALINGFVVATVIDVHHAQGTSGWAVRSYGAGADVLLSAIEVDVVSEREQAAVARPAAPVVIHPPPVASVSPDGPWTPAPHAMRHPAAPPRAAHPARAARRPRIHIDRAMLDAHLPPPVNDPLMYVASRLAVAAEVAALATHQDVWSRHAAARHPACSAVQLTKLASDLEWVVRLVVASRSDCPAIALDRLASDEKALVRHAVALNPVCPVELLERLALDRTRDIDRAVTRHPRCPPALRERLARRWGDQPVAAAPPPDWRVRDVPWDQTPSSAP